MEKKKHQNESRTTLVSFVVMVLTALAVFTVVNRYGTNRFIKILVFFMCLFLSAYIQTILHEAGHLIAGLLTGYKWGTFRIGSYLLKRENEKWCIRRYNIPGTGGQCLMIPPKKNGEKFPFVWYNLGGIMMNLLLGMISLLCMIYMRDNKVIRIISTTNLIVSCYLVLANGIPTKLTGVPNDGYNTIALCKDKKLRKEFYLDLYTYGLVLNGKRWSEIESDLFEEIELGPEHCYYASFRLLELNCCLDTLDFEKCRNIIDELVTKKKYMSKYDSLQVDAFAMLFELLGEGDYEVTSALDTQRLREFLRKSRYQPIFQLIQYAYDLIYCEDKEKADKLYPHLEKIIIENPNLGEIKLDYGVLKCIQEKYNSMEIS